MFVGSAIAVPFVLISLALLVFCACFSGRHFAAAEKTIGNYAWSVHVIAAIQEFLYTIKMFLGGRQASSIKVCGADLLYSTSVRGMQAR